MQSSSEAPPRGYKNEATAEVIAFIHERSSERSSDGVYEWDCVDCETEFYQEEVKERKKWSKAAYLGDWDEIFAILAESSGRMERFANRRRLYSKRELKDDPDRRSGYTVLHQAAYHNTPQEVVEALIALGCYRQAGSRDGRPVDIARALGFTNLIPILEPPSDRLPNISNQQMTQIQTQFEKVLKQESHDIFKPETMTPVDLRVLREIDRIWMPVPGMYGGFDLSFDGDHLVSQSHCRVVGGSGMTYHITADGATLVDEGWG
ncbi:hypothetical protein FRC17_003100 [Serendipita sp. 399]|nr:hypothetical protein FRC17_003100 [Serendipita sp. 399]